MPHALHPWSFLDAPILQAAHRSGCAQLLTEDLNDGSLIAGVRVVNPFETSSSAPGKRGRRGR